MATAPGRVDRSDHDEEFRIEFNTTGPPGPLTSNRPRDVGDTNTMCSREQTLLPWRTTHGRSGIEKACRTAADYLRDSIHGQQTRR
jgi:hypothetical protein